MLQRLNPWNVRNIVKMAVYLDFEKNSLATNVGPEYYKVQYGKIQNY